MSAQAKCFLGVCFCLTVFATTGAQDLPEEVFQVDLQDGYHVRAMINNLSVQSWVKQSNGIEVPFPRDSVAPEKVKQLKELILSEHFFDLPEHCGKMFNHKSGKRVLTVRWGSRKHSVEVLELDKQPASDEVTRFTKVWKFAYARALKDHYSPANPPPSDSR